MGRGNGVMKHLVLDGQQVILRPLISAYFYDYLSQFSLPVCNALQINDPQSEFDYLKLCIKKIELNLTIFNCIFIMQTNQLIGAIEIRHQPSSAGQLYSWLNHHWWGTGVFEIAMQLSARNYFCLSGAQSFNAHVYLENKRSYYALKKCGFVDDGMHDGWQGLQYNLVLKKDTAKT